MCGIFGIFATSGYGVTHLDIPSDAIAGAVKLMQHRGPDLGQLTFFSDFKTQTFKLHEPLNGLGGFLGALGHNRLSIIDLSPAASQPMPSATGHWIVYNGEIYNYRELKTELQSLGYTFHSQSDTEVLLALYAAHGPEMVNRLNGMFAFAIYDPRDKTLFMARDRYGIKPFYYTRLETDHAFAFASETKSLLSLPGCKRDLNPEALSEHFTFQNTFGAKTLVKSVSMLEPGHWMKLDTGSGELTIQQYWQPVFTEDFNTGTQDLIDLLRAKFETAVSRQLVGDVPIGSFLSGGMDTGAITAVTTRTIPTLHTFTSGFDVSGVSEAEQHFDEREAARFLSNHLHTIHHEMTITQSALRNVLPEVIWHLDDFRAGISYQNFMVSKLVRESVTVVMSGVGGDELLAGYPWRYAPAANTAKADFADQYYQRWVRLLSDGEKKNLFSLDLNRQLEGFSTRESFDAVLQTCQAENMLNRALCFDMKTFLHGLLIVEDRLSMAHSVESRVPFLDNDVVDLCLKLPANLKLKTDDRGEPVAKWILKEALRGLLPDEVLIRKKQGFTPPDASWYRGESRGYIEQVLLSKTALDRGLFQEQVLRNLLDAHFSGQSNHRFLIWSLLCLEWWQRLFLDESRLVKPAAGAMP